MGSRGLGAKGLNGSSPRNWNINSRNAGRYGIKIERDYSNMDNDPIVKQLHEEFLNDSLNTINQMGILLGMKPEELPAVIFKYANDSNIGVLGDAVINLGTEENIIDKKTGEIKFEPDAVINVYEEAVQLSPSTAAHELMHALEAKWIRDDISDIIGRSNAWHDHIYSDAICRNALVAIGRQRESAVNLNRKAWKEEANKIYRNTSEMKRQESYASYKPAETPTVTIQAALKYGEKNLTPYGRAILNEIRKEIQRHRKRRK